MVLYKDEQLPAAPTQVQVHILHNCSTHRFPMCEPSTSCEQNPGHSQNSSFCPLTYNREHQQDAADDDGDDDCGLSSPEVQHCDRVVELPHLDLRGGGAGAERRGAKRSEPSRDRARAALSSSRTCCPSCPCHSCTSGTLCVPQEPNSLPACLGESPAQLPAGCGGAHPRALVAEPRAPACATAPLYPPQAREHPFPESWPHRTALPALLRREMTSTNLPALVPLDGP